MIKILFIDDDAESVEDARQCIIDAIPDTVSLDVSNFEDANPRITSFQPDIVVLDLTVEPNDPSEGFTVHDFIWKTRFCPIIVYSAFTERYEDQYPKHPFIEVVKKGSGSDQRVLEAVQKLQPQIDSLQMTEAEVRNCLAVSMREVAPLAFREISDVNQRMEVIRRSGRRRIAALMDEPLPNEAAIAAWEQYIYPPISSDDPQLGDILKTADGDANDSASFRVVLTPSCDMVSSRPKVKEVLVAKCCAMSDALTSVGMGGVKNSDRIQERILTPGYLQSIIPFPKLEGVIPTMAADLRELELVKFEDIVSNRNFTRVASIDSPFRELVAWAYMQISCRPGLPNRNTTAWADEIIG